jgi:hypothetical protein
MTRKEAIKALAGITLGATVAPVILALPSKPLVLPVTPHGTGKCPGGEMCGACYDVMVEDYEDAVDPVVKRAVAAFWKSVESDLPFFRRSGSLGADITDAAKEAVACDSFEQWQDTPEAASIRSVLPPTEDEAEAIGQNSGRVGMVE